jgi:hypothetical protein
VTYDWPDADALVLVAAGFGERATRYDEAHVHRRLSVGDVLGSVDYIERIVLDAKELDGAIRRLSAAGFLKVEGHDVTLAQSGRELLRDSDGATVFDQLDRVRHHLSQLPVPDGRECRNLAPDAATRAVGAYLDKG